MGFQFAETMAGTIEWANDPGERRPFHFDITAHAESTREHIATGKATIRGVIHAPPLAESADAEGVITIRPLGQRIIRYELWFYGDDGHRYEVRGQKDIRWTSPFATFSRLPLEVTDESNHRVATCLTRFDLRRDWWSFLRSFRPA
jgi:hypothetical protein